MRSPEYAAAVAVHAAVATAAITVGAVALASRKGGRLHRRTGRGYHRAITAVVVTGAGLLAMGRFSLYLATLLLLTAYPTWSGVRVLGRKRPDADPAQQAAAADYAAAVVTLGLTVAVLAALAAGYGARAAAPTASFAAFVGAMAGYDLWRFARPAAWPMAPQLWLREHIGKLTGAYFGAVSAFSGNVFTVIPDPWRTVAPNLVGAAVMAFFLVRMRRGRRRGGLHAAPA